MAHAVSKDPSARSKARSFPVSFKLLVGLGMTRGWRPVAAAAPALLVALTLLALAACSGGTEPTRRRLPEGWRLIQKQGYQALYAPSGRLARVLADSDGDGVAEAVVFYREDGRPGRSELDTDGDHVIDRWETLRRDGTVSISASARRSSGRPDTWEYADAQGFVFQTEFDDDGDGAADRTEYTQRPEAPTDAPETP
jgi:hypothetical protein